MDAPTLTTEQAHAEIEAALAANNRSRAIDLAVEAMGRGGIMTTLVLTLVAEGMEGDGLIDDALAAFNRAQIEAPDNVEAKLKFAAALMRHSADEEAVAPLEAVLAKQPRHFEALMLRGKAAIALQDLVGAGSAFETARIAKPESDEPLTELAVLAARRGDMAGARALGQHAAALNPGAARAVVAVARADLADGDPAAAEARLKKVQTHPRLTEADRADILGVLGDALDALGKPAEAFAAWREREQVLTPMRARALTQGAGARHIALAERLAAWFSTVPKGTWRAASAADAEEPDTPSGHVFVLSFPRSGTTLLEQVLASHPQVLALDESSALGRATDHLISDDAGLAALGRLTAEAAKACRDAYWAQVRDEIGGDLRGKVFIDKSPLNSVRLPVIAKLFPGAKILFAERDPRDVVLSGYRRLSYSTMLEFHSLETTARLYDAVMRLTDLYRDRLDLTLHPARHERLVTDFEAQARGILEVIGLDWDPAVLDFARGPVKSTTPSAAQVAQGLSSESVGVWKRYAAEMASVLPLLEPWAARFGYEAGPPVSPPLTVTIPSAQVTAAVQEIVAAINGGQLPRAMDMADAALSRGLVDPLFHRLRGVRAQQQGRLDLAIADFEATLDLSGEDAPILNALGLCLARAGRAAEGLIRLDRAIALNAATAAFHFNRGWTLEVLGELPLAREAYETAVRLDPKHAQALGNLAVLAARRADWAAAREFAARALSHDSASPAAITALARAEAAQDEAPAARQRLETLLKGSRADPHERAVALSALGDVLDQLGHPAEAFAAYDQGAQTLRNLYAGRFAGTETTSAVAARLAGALADPAPWRRGPAVHGDQDPRVHVFLLGFPRSGTTMLGQALASHAEVITLDERPTLSDAAQAFLFPADGLQRLAAAASEDLETWRQAYWRRVRNAGAEPMGRVFVDKLPMNTLGLPLIVKMFPSAKILFLRRDPRDVVLSCLRRQFVIDASTIELLGLQSAARLYDRVMSLMETYRRVLDLDLREQGYEDLVEDFEPQMRQICDFVGLSFDPAMADFAGRAGLVATPSASQLAKGLNTEGVGVWRRYRDSMAPVMNALSPWVARFGYPAD
jgi:tetratricopeptide (TPR) repeat protein